MSQYENILKVYRLQINNFQKDYLETIFNINKNYKNHIGYLINLDNYVNLRNIIQSYFNHQISAKQAIDSINKLSSITIKIITTLGI